MTFHQSSFPPVVIFIIVVVIESEAQLFGLRLQVPNPIQFGNIGNPVQFGNIGNPIQFGSSASGVELSTKAYNAVCWFEKLKKFPDTDTKGFLRDCYGKADHVKKQMKDDAMINKYFGPWMIKQAMGRLPPDYGNACNSYLSTPDVQPMPDMSTMLNTGPPDLLFPPPFRAFASCLITQLEGKYGPQATQAIMNEKVMNSKPWQYTILDRDNEFRFRHGSPPFGILPDLSLQAQSWADTLAKECRMYHSNGSHTGRQYNGDKTGESISSGTGDDIPLSDVAYIASNGWYEEIKDYPFAKGFNGNSGADAKLFPKIGHFTQSIWRGTQFVGYGYSYNAKCPGMKWYLVSRYFPSGNVIGRFHENVFPPRS